MQRTQTLQVWGLENQFLDLFQNDSQFLGQFEIRVNFQIFMTLHLISENGKVGRFIFPTTAPKRRETRPTTKTSDKPVITAIGRSLNNDFFLSTESFLYKRFNKFNVLLLLKISPR